MHQTLPLLRWPSNLLLRIFSRVKEQKNRAESHGLSQFRHCQDMTQLLFTSATINILEKVYFNIFSYNQHLMRYDFVQ